MVSDSTPPPLFSLFCQFDCHTPLARALILIEMSDTTPDDDASPITDELVRRATWDRASLGTLYNDFYPPVARYCLRRLGDRQTAEDVTSEVFIHVASHIRTFGGRTVTDFRRWLFRIATNAVCAELRKSRRRRGLWTAAAESGQFVNPSAVAASAAESETLDWPTIRQALLEFDEREQAIVSLRFFADCSHAEIGAIVGASADAVRASLSRVLWRLRERFQTSRASGRERPNESSGVPS